ncbi:MAG: hypothetical protein RIQ88_282, partial [Actinomycetota bacterium]
EPDEASVVELLEAKEIQFLDWKAWLKVDAKEQALGQAEGRERVKLVDREDFLETGLGQ